MCGHSAFSNHSHVLSRLKLWPARCPKPQVCICSHMIGWLAHSNNRDLSKKNKNQRQPGQQAIWNSSIELTSRMCWNQSVTNRLLQIIPRHTLKKKSDQRADNSSCVQLTCLCASVTICAFKGYHMCFGNIKNASLRSTTMHMIGVSVALASSSTCWKMWSLSFKHYKATLKRVCYRNIWLQIS